MIMFLENKIRQCMPIVAEGDKLHGKSKRILFET